MPTFPNIGSPTERHLAFWERRGYPFVFISYRSNIDPDHDAAEILHFELRRQYGDNASFMASQSVQPATEFDVIINAALQHAKIIIPIIGPNWAASLPTTDEQRGHPWVIHEIQTAISLGTIVLPIVVTNDRRIRGDIPSEIAKISKYQTMQMPLEAPPPGDDFVVRAEKIARRVGFLVPEIVNPLIDYYSPRPM